MLEALIESREYLIHLAIMCGMYLILAQSLNLSFGMGRLFNLAHVSAFALGAYATALLSTEQGFGFFACLIASMAIAGAFTIVLGLIAMRLEQDYFAIGTLACSAVVSALLINWKSVTRGVLGIPGIPRPVIEGVELTSNGDFLILVGALVVVILGFLMLFFRNSFARSLRGMAESELAALAIGKNVGVTRNVAFFVGSACAGVGGCIFAFYINYIDPSSFSLTEMIFLLTIVVVGRPGSFWGCVAGTFFLVLLPEALRFVEIPPSVLGPLRQMIYAIILFLVMFLNRARLFPMERRL